MSDYKNEREKYQKLNRIAKKNGVVLFGAAFAKEIPVCELKQTFEMDCDIYNRSFTDLSVSDAAELLEENIMSLEPSKVLLQLGETELQNGNSDISDITNGISRIIDMIRAKNNKTEIVLVSVSSESGNTASFNSELKKLSENRKCAFADISPAFTNEIPGVKAFSMLKYYIKDTFSLYDIMNAVKI